LVIKIDNFSLSKCYEHAHVEQNEKV